VSTNWKLAEHGDDAARRLAFIVATLWQLEAGTELTAAQDEWLPKRLKSS
jgi:hypothetical protein